ncbi:MAG: hypothetical protein AB1331_02255 [Bacillota bacterium]
MRILVLASGRSPFGGVERDFPEICVSHEAPDTNYDLVVRWGVSDGSFDCLRVLNRSAALANVSTSGSISRILGINGLTYHRRRQNTKVQRYRAYILDAQLLFLGRRVKKRYGFIEVSNRETKLMRKVIETATTSVHVLGLDFACVDLVALSSRQVEVMRVQVAPNLDRRVAARFLTTLREIARNPTGRTGGELTLGADPEFMLRDSNTKRMLPASRFFPIDGRVGCDARTVSSHNHQRPLAELRPDPDVCPIRLTRNMRQLMQNALRLVPYRNVQWWAGSMPFRGFPIGGHVHFGGIRPSEPLLRALDSYLAVPIMLLEDQRSATRRRPRYGFLGDFRLQPYGGFEYRVAASWLVSPRLSQAALALSKVVVHHFTELGRDLFLDPDLQVAFYSGRKEALYNLFPSLWAELSATSTFSAYADELQIIEEMVTKRQRWNERADIRRAWHLPIPKRQFRA